MVSLGAVLALGPGAWAVAKPAAPEAATLAGAAVGAWLLALITCLLAEVHQPSWVVVAWRGLHLAAAVLWCWIALTMPAARLPLSQEGQAMAMLIVLSTPPTLVWAARLRAN